jgi:hypothetical protein
MPSIREQRFANRQRRIDENRAEAKRRRMVAEKRHTDNVAASRKRRMIDKKRGTGMRVMKGIGKTVKDVVNSALAKNIKVNIRKGGPEKILSA